MTPRDPVYSSPQHRIQAFWGRMLLPLLLSLTGLILGWHPGEPGHSQLASASQTVPALPDLRPLRSPQPAVQGVGPVPEPLRDVPLTRWTLVGRRPAAATRDSATDLLLLGRMNLDGG